MTQNPKKQEILRNEIVEKLPTKDSSLTADSLKNIPYLRACMKESARLMPIAVGSVRRLTEDLELGGYLVPKGVSIVLT